nr:MAG TPA: hypothetical protein [Bacteriophage sp.]
MNSSITSSLVLKSMRGMVLPLRPAQTYRCPLSWSKTKSFWCLSPAFSCLVMLFFLKNSDLLIAMESSGHRKMLELLTTLTS